MKISFEIKRDEAVIAIMYYLGLGIEIKTKKQFKQQLTSYFWQNGLQCQDDHECENEPYREAAEALVNKYFK